MWDLCYVWCVQCCREQSRHGLGRPSPFILCFGLIACGWMLFCILIDVGWICPYVLSTLVCGILFDIIVTYRLVFLMCRQTNFGEIILTRRTCYSLIALALFYRFYVLSNLLILPNEITGKVCELILRKTQLYMDGVHLFLDFISTSKTWWWNFKEGPVK